MLKNEQLLHRKYSKKFKLSLDQHFDEICDLANKNLPSDSFSLHFTPLIKSKYSSEKSRYSRYSSLYL